jgi:hypothetical protein
VATKPIEPEELTVVQRIIARADSRVRAVVLVAIAAACISLAPVPFGALGAATVALMAFELGKRR